MQFDDLLDEATLAEVEVPVCLNGKLRAKHSALSAELAEARAAAKAEAESPDTRLAKGGAAADVERLAKALDEVVVEMGRYTQVFTLRALPKDEWNALWAEHPPRTDKSGKRDPRDNGGFNASTFYPALLRKSVVLPEMSAARWEKLDAKISDIQFDKLATAAWLLNRHEEDVPFSRAA
jgi:hypothetical protein